MNIFLQIGLGLLPGTIVTLILLIVRKAFNLKKILLSLLLTIICGVLMFLGIRNLADSGIKLSNLSRKDMISFANALVLEGAFEEATEVLDQYSENYGYDDECRLLNARISLLEEDYEVAYGLYSYLSENTDLISGGLEEVSFAEEKAQADSSDSAIIEYLESIGENIEDYGYTEEAYNEIISAEQTSVDDIKKDIESAIEDAYSISESARDCAEAVAGVSESYENLLDDEESTTNKYKRIFNSIEEDDSEYPDLICVKKARIKAYVLAGDYESITENLDSNSSYHELMISAELYMSGLVEKSDFSDEYQKIDRQEASAVKSQVSAIYKKYKDDLTVQDRKNLKSRVTAISNQMDEEVLVTIKEQLTDAAENEADTDKTKVYLELAKIEDYFGNETSTDTYISEAIYSSQDCRDDSYVAAMSDIISVINNDEDDDTENIKSVSEYVDTVLSHSLTVNVESIVSPQYQPETVSDTDSYDDDTDDDSESDDQSDTYDFAQTATDYVSKAKSAISIGKIDVSDFENITAEVQIDSDYITDTDELKNSIKVYDCGAEITDFTLEKIEYTESNVILLCDVSGSMDGSIQDLRDAVAEFITDKNTSENVAIVTFNDSIVETRSFGTSDEVLLSFAESMNANGGTDMFSAVVECLDNFPSGGSSNNVLILMTDGQDNNPKSDEEIYEGIGEFALQNDVTVYTVGLGSDVDTAYLSTIADYGNGEFVYVSDSASLTSFYNMLHSRINSQYKLKYTALDTMTMSGRTLEVTLPSENVRDLKTYSLEGADEEESSLEISEGISVSGISPGQIYKSLQDIEVKLKGSGFSKDSSITIKLNGNIDYVLEASYADEETYLLTIPSSIAVGSYDVEITIDGKKKILQNGFSVVCQGDEKKTAFGPYVFTSSEKIENSDGSYTLRGSVTMNGWLHFKGDVTLSGDIDEGGSVNVTDNSGAYVEFDESTAEGFGSYLAEKGICIYLPALYEFTLYNDTDNIYNYADYMVDDISISSLCLYNLLIVDEPVVRLYPNSIGMYFSTGSTMFPYQDKIFANLSKDKCKFSFNTSAQITNKNVGLVVELDYSDPDKIYERTINFFNSPVYFNGELEVKIDTINDEYKLGAMIGMAFFEKASGIGAEIEWKGKLIPDAVTLKVKKSISLPTAIPVKVDKFSFEVSNINDALSQDSFTEAIKSLEFTGTVSLSSLKIKDYFPELGKVVGDISILSVPEASASFCLSPFKVEAEATLKFLSEITLAKAGVKLGQFDYTNNLLQLDNVSVSGLSAYLTTGLMCDMADGRVKLNITGTGELDAHSRFIGTTYNGTMEYDISWWLINTEEKVSGDAVFGLYTTHDEKLEMVFVYKYTDSKGKIKGAFYYIDENGKCGKDNITLS